MCDKSIEAEMTVNCETPFKLHAIDLCSRRIRNNRSGCQHLTELKIRIVIMVDRQIGQEGSAEPARLQAGFIAPDRFGPEGRRDSTHGKATTRCEKRQVGKKCVST